MAKTATVPRIRAKTPIGILKAVVRIIRAEPLRYYQSDWIRTFSPRKDKRMPPCGTVCCVAGWVAIGTSELKVVDDFGWGDVRKHAMERLGIDVMQSGRLFDGDAVGAQWDYEGRNGPVPEVGTKRYVEVGVRHIERFMRDELGYTGPKL